MRRELIQFLDALSLHLVSGFELSYSWQKTFLALSEILSPKMKGLLISGDQGIASLLSQLGRSFPIVTYRIWFNVLQELYLQGAGILDAVISIADSLRKEESRDSDNFYRTLHTRTNVKLILFFLPPALLLLFTPLLLELLATEFH